MEAQVEPAAHSIDPFALTVRRLVMACVGGGGKQLDIVPRPFWRGCVSEMQSLKKKALKLRSSPQQLNCAHAGGNLNPGEAINRNATHHCCEHVFIGRSVLTHPPPVNAAYQNDTTISGQQIVSNLPLCSHLLFFLIKARRYLLCSITYPNSLSSLFLHRGFMRSIGPATARHLI